MLVILPTDLSEVFRLRSVQAHVISASIAKHLGGDWMRLESVSIRYHLNVEFAGICAIVILEKNSLIMLVLEDKRTEELTRTVLSNEPFCIFSNPTAKAQSVDPERSTYDYENAHC